MAGCAAEIEHFSKMNVDETSAAPDDATVAQKLAGMVRRG